MAPYICIVYVCLCMYLCRHSNLCHLLIYKFVYIMLCIALLYSIKAFDEAKVLYEDSLKMLTELLGVGE